MFIAEKKIGEMKIGRGNRSTQRKPAPAPLRPPQIKKILRCLSTDGLASSTLVDDDDDDGNEDGDGDDDDDDDDETVNPCTIIGKVTVLYILIFKTLDGAQEEETS
jgi:hypothetical protein